ncbi:MAG: GMC family oxidoreductase [Dehalococcoidia bacterium]
MKYDYVIVGAGSSGAALAARLTEDPGTSVLLLEAGPDYPDVDKTPYDLQNSFWVSVLDHDWRFKADAVAGRPIDYPRGKVTGGSSAVNAAMAIRGVPSDYDEWAAWGNDEWSWEKVLPSFRKLEDDQDQGGDFHGKGGPVPVVRWKKEELIPLQTAFLDACLERGYPYVEDNNDPTGSGVGPIAMNRRGRLRMSTAVAYLGPNRHRLNLTIRGNCHVDRVLFEGKKAVGVELECGGELQRVYGENIVLSAGAVQSPPILWRSGVGPKEKLAALGIDCLIDQPAVGANLIDHPQAFVGMIPKEGVCSMDNPLVQILGRYTAPGSSQFNDMQLYMINHVDMTQFPELMETFGGHPMIFSIMTGLQRPNSRGAVSINTRDFRAAPVIDLHYYDDEEDMRRSLDGMRRCWEISNLPAMQEKAQGTIILTQEIVDDDEQLAAYIRAVSSTIFHPVGTCKMGPDTDPGAVVDQYCRVKGVEGLRVVDASIMPNIVTANTNFTCMMIGEKVADFIKAGT